MTKSLILAMLTLVMASSFAGQAQAGHNVRGAISICDDPICIVFGNLGHPEPRHFNRHHRPHRWGHGPRRHHRWGNGPRRHHRGHRWLRVSPAG